MTLRSCGRAALLAAVVAAVACGGHGIDAPFVPAVGEDAICPSAEEATQTASAAFDDERVSAVSNHLERILVDDGGLRLLVAAVLRVIHDVPPEQMLGMVDGFELGLGAARLTPHLALVAQYIHGSSDYVGGEHYGALDALYRVFGDSGRDCDSVATLGAIRRMLVLEVENDAGETVPWLDVAFDVITDVASDDGVVELIERIEFDDGGGGDLNIGRDAFTLILRLVVANLAEEDFDLEYVRGLIDDLIVFQLPVEGASRVKLNALLDQLEVLMDREREIFPYAQSFIRCVAEVDDEGHLVGMIYDYLSIEELDYIQFLEDLDRVSDDPAGIALRITAVEAITSLESDPAFMRDSVGALNRLFSPEVTRDLVPAVLALRGTGVLTDVIVFFRQLFKGCGAASGGGP